LLVGAVVVAACASPQPRPKLEEQVRKVAPIPACVSRLEGRGLSPGVARGLTTDQYWKLLFPSYDESARRLPPRAVACTGDDVLGDPLLTGATARPPSEVEPLFGSGGDRLKVVWLRTHVFADGTTGGPIALVRALGDDAELYAVGVVRAHPERVRLGVERIGGELLVTVHEDSCAGRAAGTACETRLRLLSPHRGNLHAVASIALERVELATGTEPGVPGRVEYHLTTTPKYMPNGLRLVEQVRVTDLAGRPLRKAELERLLTPRGAKPMAESEEALWGRVVPRASATAPATSAPSGSG
jgi:hypothetical protein